MEVVISFLQLIAFLQFVVDFHTDKYCLARDFAALFFFFIGSQRLLSKTYLCFTNCFDISTWALTSIQVELIATFLNSLII